MENDNQMEYPGATPPYDQSSQIGGNITQNFDKGPKYDPLPQPQYGTGYITQSIEQGPQGKLPVPPPPPKQLNLWKVATQVLLVIVVILAATTLLAYYHIINAPSPSTAIATSTVSVATQGVPQATATQGVPKATATQGVPQATAVTGTPTAQTLTSADYSATQPGPGCDTNGGTWTPQGLGSINCGTQVAVGSNNAFGYLYLQLPNNRVFSPTNKIGVIGSPSGGYGRGSQCIGLAEQDASTGFLAAYCDNGQWSVYTVSSQGVVVQTLAQSVTSTRATVDILLTLRSATLSFSIDTEVHQINITPIQPTRVSIAYFCTYGDSVASSNFTYTALSS